MASLTGAIVKLSNRLKLVLFMLVILSASAFAELPKVAVLDAVLPKGIDKNVSVVVTEKLNEQLVKSGKFVVLDRTTVGQSLKEIEFQMSGLVGDAELKKAGAQLSTRLGASFVVVAQVSVVSGTYFVSAKMIDVKTGEITAQASDEEEGKVSVIFKIAERAGSKLAAGARAVAVSGAAATTQSEAEGKGELSDRDPLPTASITIDGNSEDWKSVAPAFFGPPPDKQGNMILDKVRLAVDRDNLYMAIDIRDPAPSSFARPHNFDRTHVYSSYGVDVIGEKNWLILEMIYIVENDMNSWVLRIGKWDPKRQSFTEISRAGKRAMRGSFLEAAVPMTVLRKYLGPPSTYCKISARAGYPAGKEWVTTFRTKEKSFTF